ncbi:GGDEF domain-containing protein [Halalkalibacter alkaliphilus]|uniref:GGDEF domain-containing protein n=1 Tax=Halalkalibacter alkaliphilus TaxID=2917993 RepID=A0A9X2CVX5_9BACI|nr:GGDEF domain-containing protein [Halalkalibacter alkaliphilus]MCL7749238.1 GGDEF domain-containing protein [Halalkalibacter alkaliphilus]
MKFFGRIITTITVLLVNLIYMLYYFLRDGFISQIEYIGLPLILFLAWHFGKQYDRAKFLSEKDPLTEIYNRRYAEAFFPKVKAMTDRNGQKLAVLVLDVNNFKTINDHLGHKKGDEVLKILSRQLKKSVRETDIVARWGGDEFIILTPDIKEKENVEEIKARIQKNLKKVSNSQLDISVSIGSAIYPSLGENLDELVKEADKNMYEMKLHLKQHAK